MATPLRVPARSRNLRDEIDDAEEQGVVQNLHQDQDFVDQDEMVEVGLVDEADVDPTQQQQQQPDSAEPNTPRVRTRVWSPAQTGGSQTPATRPRAVVDDLEVTPITSEGAACLEKIIMSRRHS